MCYHEQNKKYDKWIFDESKGRIKRSWKGNETTGMHPNLFGCGEDGVA